jgi:hypothetical protein
MSNAGPSHFKGVLGRLKRLDGLPVMIEISPTTGREGELASLTRSRVDAVESFADRMVLRLSSVSGDPLGNVEIREDLVSWAHADVDSIEFDMQGTFVKIWDTEELVNRDEYSDAQLWEEFGLASKGSDHGAVGASTSVIGLGFAEVVERLCGRIGEATRVEICHTGSGDIEVASFPEIMVCSVETTTEGQIGNAVRVYLGKDQVRWFSVVAAEQLFGGAEYDGESLSITLDGILVRIFDPNRSRGALQKVDPFWAAPEF